VPAARAPGLAKAFNSATGTAVGAARPSLAALALALAPGLGEGQTFHYVEPADPSCPQVPSPTGAGPKTVVRGMPVPGRIQVNCGFGQGSYTVTLNATDPGASFIPRTFLVNFGRVVGDGVFVLRFSTAGVQRVSATITSNMGSPPVRGRFTSAADEFEVVVP
jgi:hypothetical protein